MGAINGPVPSTATAGTHIAGPTPTSPKLTVEQAAHTLLYQFDTSLNGLIDKQDPGTAKLRSFLRTNGAKVGVPTPGTRGYDAQAIADAIASAKVAGRDGKLDEREMGKLFGRILDLPPAPPAEIPAAKEVGRMVDGFTVTNPDGTVAGRSAGFDVNGDHVLDQTDIDNDPYRPVGTDGPVAGDQSPVKAILDHLGVDRITTPAAKEFLAKYAGADRMFTLREFDRLHRFLFGTTPMTTGG